MDPVGERRDARFWSLQRQTYAELGPEAFTRQQPVPHYVTNTPLLAEAYARLMLAFVADRRRADPLASAVRSDPVYVIELGGGLGKFAYYFLRALSQQTTDGMWAGLTWLYVLSDISLASLERWQLNRQLAPYVEKGLLDFARFDVTRDEQFQLRLSGAVVDFAATRSELVVIGNYLFDSVPLDVFQWRDGSLDIGAVRFEAPDDEVRSLSSTRWQYEYKPIGSGRDAYPGDPILAAIIDDYGRGASYVRFAVPIECIRFARRAAARAPGRVLLLVGDKGPTTLVDARSLTDPAVAMHDNVVSVQVNFHALAEHVRRAGGTAYLPQAPHSHFLVGAFLPGKSNCAWTQMNEAYCDVIDRFGPADVLPFLQASAPSDPAALVRWFLSLLRMTRDDPEVVLRYGETVAGALGSATEGQQRLLSEALGRVGDNLFPVSPADGRVYRTMARLEYGLKRFHQALDLLERALALNEVGNGAQVLFNIGLCHMSLGQWAEAERNLVQAAALEPADAATVRLLASARSHLASKSTRSVE